MTVRLERFTRDEPVGYRRGRTWPRAIAWFGFSAFWGHLRHLLASAIATDNIDSRQWMTPEAPNELLGRALEILEARGADPRAPSLAAAFGGEVWIDFIADTGDDVTVSEAVASLLFEDYTVDDPDEAGRSLLLPRGQVLLHGGDLAYPVATVREVTRRLIVPWNRVLERRDVEAPRLLLGVPGNHDWYDGLDGFARLCQAACDFETPAPREESVAPRPSEFPVLAWARAFSRGVSVRKPDALALIGYFPAQRASYFRLPLTAHVELWGVDRQLRQIDPRQRAYFGSASAETPLVVLPDPARAWGDARPNGVASLEALALDPRERRAYILTGDVHHYERSNEGPSVHVVAGGGGAFLHGGRSAAGGLYEIVAQFPGPRASSRLLWLLPWWCASGGAGMLLVVVFAIVQAIGLAAYAQGDLRVAAGVATGETLVVAYSTALLVGWIRHRRHRVVPFALGIGLFIAALPQAMSMLFDRMGAHMVGPLPSFVVAWAGATFLSCAGFGAMLAIIARLGLNHAQPYAALGLPTHKHFLRMRVREQEDGTVIDSFVVGQEDPVGGSKPGLVDSFRWTSERGAV